MTLNVLKMHLYLLRNGFSSFNFTGSSTNEMKVPGPHLLYTKAVHVCMRCSGFTLNTAYIHEPK